MKKPDYCTNERVASCWECSLTNYGRDCQNVSVTAREDGSRGGSAKTAAKQKAARANGALGGRPRKS